MQHVTDRASKAAELRAALESGSFPRTPHAGCNEVLRVLAGVRGACLSELRSLPLGEEGQRLVALRHFIAHGSMWIRHFAWEQPLARVAEDGATTVARVPASGGSATTLVEGDGLGFDLIPADRPRLVVWGDGQLRMGDAAKGTPAEVGRLDVGDQAPNLTYDGSTDTAYLDVADGDERALYRVADGKLRRLGDGYANLTVLGAERGRVVATSRFA